MKKKWIFLVIILMVVGFAAISTTLYINGQTKIAANENDFDVYFSKAFLDDVDVSDTVISTDGKTITYKTNDLSALNDVSELDYEVTNNSSQYNARIDINCTIAENDKVKMTNTLADDLIEAKSTVTGSITVELIKSAVVDEDIALSCVLDVNAEERDSIGISGSDVPGQVNTYSIYGYFYDSNENVVPNANLVVYSETPHYVTTDNRGYFYVEGLEVGSHEIYYVGEKSMIGSSKEEVKQSAFDKVNITTSTSNIVFEDGHKITGSTIEKTNNKEIEITFDVVGGGSIVTQTVQQNGKYGELPEPTKEGYTFANWVFEDGTIITSDTIVPTGENHKLIATYRENTYTIKFDGNGGTGAMQNLNASYTSQVKLSSNEFINKGSSFVGWNTAKDGSGTSYIENALVSKLVSEANGELVLYAQWKTNAYVITLDPNGGTISNNSIIRNYDDLYGELETPLKEGYEFAGWYLDDTKVEESTNILVSSNHTLKAKWTANEYLVILNPNGGEIDNDEVMVKYGSTYGELVSPTRTGYTFQGWYTAIDGGEKVTSTTQVKITSTQNLYAHWKANEYTVTLDVAGGTIAEDTIKVKYDGLYENLVTPSRTGYTFQGWYLENTLIDSMSKVTITEDITLVAKWTVNNYSLKFDANGGTVNIVGKDVTYGKEVGDLPEPTREGYTFQGWYSALNGGSKYTSTTLVMFTKETTIYAHWTVNSYVLNFNANGGTVGEGNRTVVYGSAVGELPTPSRTGYTFQGWYTALEGGVKYTSTTVVTFTKETTLYAQWTANMYNLKFDANNGSVTETVRSVAYGSPVGTLPTPTRPGYNFTGWYTAKEGGALYQDTTIVSFLTETTIYAHWELAEISITFAPNGGSVSETSRKVLYTNAIGTLPTATRTGYTFNGWYDSNNNKYESTTKVMNTSAFTLTAKWTANTYTITFDPNGGTLNGSSTKTVTFDQTLGTLPSATLSKKTFMGWTTTKDGSSYYYASTKMTKASNMTLYAKWGYPTYGPGQTVTFGGDSFHVLAYSGPTTSTVQLFADLALDSNGRQSSSSASVAFSTSSPAINKTDTNLSPLPDGSVKTMVDSYVSYLKTKTGVTNITGTLPTFSELVSLGCTSSTCANSNYVSWVAPGRWYWTRTTVAQSSPAKLYVVNGTSVTTVAYTTGGYLGARPVITVPKDSLS